MLGASMTTRKPIGRILAAVNDNRPKPPPHLLCWWTVRLAPMDEHSYTWMQKFDVAGAGAWYVDPWAVTIQYRDIPDTWAFPYMYHVREAGEEEYYRLDAGTYPLPSRVWAQPNDHWLDVLDTRPPSQNWMHLTHHGDVRHPYLSDRANRNILEQFAPDPFQFHRF